MLIAALVLGGFAVMSMARLPESEREQAAALIDAALSSTLGECVWTHDRTAREMALDASQYGRMRRGLEGFDLARVFRLPVDMQADFFARLLALQGGVRYLLASHGLRMARATVPVNGARKDQRDVA